MSSRFFDNTLIALIAIALFAGAALWWQYSRSSGSAQTPTLVTNTTKSNATNSAKDTSPRYTLLVGGDVMLDRGVRLRMKKNGQEYPWSAIKSAFVGYNDVLLNLETPITDFPSTAVSGGPLIFTSDAKNLPIMRAAGITMVNLANNHTANKGQKGLDQTHAYLQENNIAAFGDPENEAGFRSFTREINGKHYAFVGFHGVLAGTGLDENALTPEILAEVTALSKTATVIVVAHWGDEYKANNNALQARWAHAFLDAGASVVFAHHPHVVENIEVYKGKPIFYSLGNFIFDQDFSVETREGLLIAMTDTGSTLAFGIKPVWIQTSQPRLVAPTEAKKKIDALLDRSALTGATRTADGFSVPISPDRP